MQPRARLGQPLLEVVALAQPLRLLALLLVVLEVDARQLRLLLRVQIVELREQRGHLPADGEFWQRRR